MPMQGSSQQHQDRVGQAQDYLQRALQHYQKGNLTGAIKCLGTALDLDRSLRNDDRVKRFSARVVGLSTDQAIDALTDLKSREALIQQAGKRFPTKSTSLQAQPLWILGSAVLFLTVMAIVALIFSGQMKLSSLDISAGQSEVEFHHLATDSEQAYLVVTPFGTTPIDGWPVLVAVHGNGQTGQDMVNLLGDMTRNNGILLIAPTFMAVHDGEVNDSFYTKASNNLISVIEEVKVDGLVNPQHFTHYLGQVFFGYGEGSSLVTLVARQGIDYPDAGYTRQGPMGVVLLNPRAPLFDAATYWIPPAYLLLYGELAPYAGISRDYHRRLKNQGADVYIESAAGADESVTPDQINKVASFVCTVYEPGPTFLTTPAP